MIAEDEIACALLVSGDDWQGLYVNRLLVAEGHSVPAFEIGEALLGLYVREFGTREVSSAWLEEQMSLPFDLDDIPDSSWL